MIDPTHELDEPSSQMRWFQRPGLAYLLPTRMSPRNVALTSADAQEQTLEPVGEARLLATDFAESGSEFGN